MNGKIRTLLIIGLLVSLALACSLSPQQNEPVDQNALDTMVAETIAVSAGDDTSDQQPDDDGSGGGEDTGGQEEPTAEPTATEAPTNTPEPSPTPTESPTATTEPTLPVGIDDLDLGSPDILYEFNSKGSTYTFSDTDSATEVKDGTFQYTIFDALDYTIWTFPFSKVIEDYYFEVSITMPSDCVGKDRAGIIFGTPSGETDNGINFDISCEGKYRLWIWDGSESTFLIGWTDSDELNSGPGKTNKIGVVHRGQKISLYLNGTLVDQVSDDTYVGPGRIGFNVGVDDHDNVTFKFDNAAYWTNLP